MRNLLDLAVSLIVVYGLDNLVVANLPWIVRREGVNSVVAPKVLQFVLIPSAELLFQLLCSIIYLLLQGLLLQEPLMLRIVHPLHNATLLFNGHP